MRVGVNGRFLAARPTGVQRFAREVTRGLAQRTDMTLLVPSDVTDADIDQVAPDGDRRFRVGRGGLRGAAWEQLMLPSAARRADVDVVLHPANACPRFGGPHVQVLHDVTPLTRPRDFSLQYRAWTRFAHVAPARRAARLVSVSAHSADEIARVVGVPRDRISVVHQGVGPLDAPATAEAVARVRSELGLTGPYFLTLGAGDPRKGVPFVARSFERWKASGAAPGAVALVAVGGRSHGVHSGVDRNEGVLYAGQVDDETLRALYTGAAAFLFASEEEGFGRPPLEALACGTRVVTTPYAVAVEVLGEAADRVPRDPGAWGDALTAVFSESERRRAERIKAGAAWAERYTWSRTVEELSSVLEEVAGVSRTSAGAG